MPTLNKPAKPGYKYAHPGETSGESYAPHPKERVLESQASDIERVRKGLDPNKESPAQTAARRNAPQGNLSSKDAAGRAILRSLGRAGYAGAALQGGYEAGRALDEATGAGKKIVEKSGLGAAAERLANKRDKVELSEESKARIARGDLEEKRKETSKPSKPATTAREEESTEPISGKYRPGRNEEIDDETRESAGGYKRGGKVSISKASKRADGIAQRGKTRGRYL